MVGGRGVFAAEGNGAARVQVVQHQDQPSPPRQALVQQVLDGVPVQRLIVLQELGARLTVDGQLEYSVPANGRVVVRKADYEVNMITFEDRDYFQTLRTKMGWGQHNGGVNSE